jgi:F420H(2)-dependent quinone reductase
MKGDEPMPLTGEYEPSPSGWVREQVETYEQSGGTKGNTLRDTGLPVVLVTYLGRKSGKIRKIALMRVEEGERYALVASKGGAPQHPEWYYSLRDNPTVMIQDGTEPRDFTVRVVEGAERAEWWEKSVAAFPNYAEYQQKTDRQIPVFVAEPA